jgi:hypothetical protein
MRTCMFCDGAAATKEHAWPAWLVRRFPSPSGVSVDLERGGVALDPWRLATAETTVKFLCASCNNGWMSQLESRAMPVIASLLDDSSITLSPSTQTTLALWAVKTAMVFEVLREGRDWFYDSLERTQVRNGVLPSGHTSVWVAKCFNLPGMYCSGSDLFESAEERSGEARGYVATLAFGSLAFQVLSVKPPESIPPGVVIAADMQPGPWSDVALPIAPTQRQVHWPPAIGLDGEAGIEALRRRFRA